MYYEFYGLRECPFGSTPDPKYLFASHAHKEALAHVTYGIEERRGFVLILGEVGTGKTTLVRHILERFGPDNRSVFLFNSSLAFDELLKATLRDLEVPVSGDRRVDLVDALNDYLLKENAAGRRVVLFLDEAQNLSATVLEDIRMLSNLETARSKFLQIVLAGQPELAERLGQPGLRQLRQRIGLVAELKPLSRRDTARYVAHRLAVAGRKGRRIFTRPALRIVHQASNGIPRVINAICDKSLLLGYGCDKKRVGRRIVREVVKDLSVIRTHAAHASRHTIHQPPIRRRAKHRARHAPLVGQIAAVAVGALLASGLLVVHPQSPEQNAVVGPPVAAPSVIAHGAEGVSQLASFEPPVIEPQVRNVTDPPIVEEKPATDRPQTGAIRPDVPPSSDVLTVPMTSRSPRRAVAVVTIRRGDTLPSLLHSVYGRTDDTVVDAVQFANPGVNGADLLRAGQRLYFPPVGAASMVYKLADQRYVVHLLTTSDPTDLRFRRLSAAITAAGRKVRLVPVRLWTGCEACFRVWVGEFSSPSEAEAFYRHAHPEDAA